MFNEVRNILLHNLLWKTLGSNLGGHLTLVTRVAMEYVPCQKRVIQGHPDSKPVFRIMFQAIISLDVSPQTVFLHHIVRKVYFEGLFRMFFVSI